MTVYEHIIIQASTRAINLRHLRIRESSFLLIKFLIILTRCRDMQIHKYTYIRKYTQSYIFLYMNTYTYVDIHAYHMYTQCIHLHANIYTYIYISYIYIYRFLIHDGHAQTAGALDLQQKHVSIMAYSNDI